MRVTGGCGLGSDKPVPNTNAQSHPGGLPKHSSADTRRNHSLVPLPTFHAITAWVLGSLSFKDRAGEGELLYRLRRPTLRGYEPAFGTTFTSGQLLPLDRQAAPCLRSSSEGSRISLTHWGISLLCPGLGGGGGTSPWLHQSYVISPGAFPPQGLGLLIKK